LKLPEHNATICARVQVASDFEQRVSDGAGGFTVQDERDGYAVLDLYASYRPEMIDGLRLDIGVDNVLDEDYERVFEGVSEPGTNFKIAASWQFGQ
ncbi:MAG: TonB-dependent receptor, partial [Pseudomonadota bacterium]